MNQLINNKATPKLNDILASNVDFSKIHEKFIEQQVENQNGYLETTKVEKQLSTKIFR